MTARASPPTDFSVAVHLYMPGRHGALILIAPSGSTPLGGSAASSPPNSISPWVRTNKTDFAAFGALTNLKAGEFAIDLHVETPAQVKLKSGLFIMSCGCGASAE